MVLSKVLPSLHCQSHERHNEKNGRVTQNKMNTQSKFTVTNTQTNWSKSKMTFEDVRKFHFGKMSKSNFSKVAVVDYQITDEDTKEVYNMSQVSL